MISFIFKRDMTNSEYHEKIKKHLARVGLKSAYRDKPREKENLYEIHSKEVLQYIYDTCYKWLKRFGWDK